MRPAEIETNSFKIIDDEAGSHHFSPEEWNIVRRIIHTTADFEFKDTVRIHKDAIVSGIEAIRNGKPIITDTQMAKSGIRKRDLFGNDVICLIDDPTVIEVAAKTGQTRSRVAVDIALETVGGEGIWVIGNAPTALLRLIDRVKTDTVRPSLVAGFPVGFVNARESKELLMTLDVPYISNIGRKGGSSIAAGVINALIIMAQSKQKEG